MSELPNHEQILGWFQVVQKTIYDLKIVQNEIASLLNQSHNKVRVIELESVCPASPIAQKSEKAQSEKAQSEKSENESEQSEEEQNHNTQQFKTPVSHTHHHSSTPPPSPRKSPMKRRTSFENDQATTETFPPHETLIHQDLNTSLQVSEEEKTPEQAQQQRRSPHLFDDDDEEEEEVENPLKVKLYETDLDVEIFKKKHQ